MYKLEITLPGTGGLKIEGAEPESITTLVKESKKLIEGVAEKVAGLMEEVREGQNPFEFGQDPFAISGGSPVPVVITNAELLFESDGPHPPVPSSGPSDSLPQEGPAEAGNEDPPEQPGRETVAGEAGGNGTGDRDRRDRG